MKDSLDPNVCINPGGELALTRMDRWSWHWKITLPHRVGRAGTAISGTTFTRAGAVRQAWKAWHRHVRQKTEHTTVWDVKL